MLYEVKQLPQKQLQEMYHAYSPSVECGPKIIQGKRNGESESHLLMALTTIKYEDKSVFLPVSSALCLQTWMLS